MSWIQPTEAQNLLKDFDTSGLSDLLGFITSQIDPCEAYIESLSGRKFSESASMTKAVDGTGTYTLFLPDRPLIEVSACKIYSGATVKKDFTKIGYEDGTRPAEMDLLVNKELGRLTSLDVKFTQGIGNIVVTYKYGYPICPEEIRLAGAMLVGLQVLDKLSGKVTGGLRGVSIGDYREEYGDTLYAQQVNHWTEFIQKVIAQYRKGGIY